MKITWRTEWPHLVVLAALFFVAAVAWPLMPDKIPVHWNLVGEVDRYGGKLEGLLLFPAIIFGMYWLLLLLPFIDPRRENYAKFQASYLVLRWSLTLFMTAVYGLILATALGQPIDMNLCMSLLMSALFVVIGWMLGYVEPNWFTGIRTPWTLSSRLSWTKTHQAGKWVFIVLGLSFLPLGFFKAIWALAIVLTIGIGGIAGLVVYSYLVWKRDPERADNRLTGDESSGIAR